MYDGYLVRRRWSWNPWRPKFAERDAADRRPADNALDRIATDKMSVVQTGRPIAGQPAGSRAISDQCLARIGLLGRDWLAGPAVACGSAVNEVDWASRGVERAISAWY